jgi:hypothetical protein
MANVVTNGTVVRFRREPTFQSYVTLNKEDDVVNTEQTEQQITPLAKSDTLQSSSSLAENGWLVVSSADPILSLTAPNSSVSVDDSVTSSTMTDSGSGFPKRIRSLDGSDRLCGYLNKYKVGARSVTRAFKRRWFEHANSSCKLLYYRTASDQIPLGEIDVAHAALSFNATDGLNSNVFEVRYEIVF